MATFYDALSGQVVEMHDWLDKNGNKARARAARDGGSNQGGNQSNRPGLGTAYTVGSHRSYNPKATPKKVVTILDLGENVDLLSPGNID